MARWGLAAVLVVLTITSAQADQATAIQAAKAQPRVLDALVDNSGNLYVFVKPEKAPWGMFAAGLCGVVKPHQGRIFRTRVIDVTQVNHGKPPGTWTRLAEADCGR